MLYAAPQLFNALETLDGLRQALATAIQLEHATIPPYLTAAFSLHGAVNGPIRELIWDVAIEEMLHMTLACNLLNAIGGDVVLDSPDFTPKYPDRLPGTINETLIVGLEPYSAALVEGVFMEIEEPENPLHFPEVLLSAAGPKTIGQFYQAVKLALQGAGAGVFTGDLGRQIARSIGGDRSIAVGDLATAEEAIDLIVGQGEGKPDSPLSPSNPQQPELAHYYRFQQLVKGRWLRPEGDTFVFRVPIDFNAAEVYPMKPNLKIAELPEGSPARLAVEAFSRAYTEMLRALHDGFRGQPRRIGEAVSTMFELTDLADAALAIEIAPGVHAGPTFEYLPA